MENIEIVDNIDDNIIDSIFFISSKSEYIHLSKDYIKQYIEDKYHKVIIIKDSNQITGFLIYFLLEPDIDIIFIATYPNNNGYGNKLLSYMFNDSKKNNIKSIKLDLHENNINAKKFYLKNGFKEIAVRKKYYNNQFNAVIMEMKIN
ncbi:GNAT family N-acetyltransferase [Brachyspira hyodysenteriae]|uniref:Ribosomal-protein-alanine acetyltransferase n=2 Tax=Brachyspira hyodysenteriae TaxID=159 RepID=A0A3B6V8Y7_BRAHW|nr:GNAT family N-acetyltransferase [Brachyspira hyodysenteriae]ACN82969.1 ribosomal-protein-alanine acetyltransferase [Brachyspira hyodysenteriae WA1]ANN62439.1 alanine acetyltransferase [Brachyspira hyodysenteriae ATCC 27164]AUJ48716.1 alanine acetyltransferase [Brachyspira hyodysenteriae]KLI16357.1 alanine acetyltransferase [Brachyspira hyodysenteriae]KLI16974.1 alanine acetyltransferase [Brachyspira hyodysenteriae]